MNKHLKFLIILLITINCYSQECELQNNNVAYLLKFETMTNSSEKIQMIKEKLIYDKIFIPDLTTTKCNIEGHTFMYKNFHNKWKNENGENCGKKILHYVFYKKGKEMAKLDELLEPENSEILNYLNQKNIEKILVFDTNYSKTLFGENGVDTKSIVIYTNDKNIKKLITNIRRNKKTTTNNGLAQ